MGTRYGWLVNGDSVCKFFTQKAGVINYLENDLENILGSEIDLDEKEVEKVCKLIRKANIDDDPEFIMENSGLTVKLIPYE